MSANDAPTIGRLARAFLSVGLLSFGGAAAQIAMMHRLAVEERRWVSDAEFERALGFCMLLPGPEAQQLATWIGWRLHGVAGGLIAGVLFVLPGAAIMLALSALYVLGGGIGWVEGLFFGVKAAVVAVVAQAMLRLASRAAGSRTLLATAAAAFLALALFKVPFPLVLATAALAGLIFGSVGGLDTAAVVPSPRARVSPTVGVALVCLAAWFAPLAALALALGPQHVAVEMGLAFSKLAALSFGGAYALLVWLTDVATAEGWATTAEMIAGLGLAETTPGPTILVTQFVAFVGAFRDPGGLPPLASGTIAALAATWATFAPSFLWIFAGAPRLDDLMRSRRVAAAIAGVTAAVLGAIAWLALWFALNTLFRKTAFLDLGLVRLPNVSLADLDGAALALALLALALTFVFRRGMIEVIGVSAALGVIWRLTIG